VTLPVVWLPEAQAELMEALAHYDAIRPELGERFANTVVETAEAIATMPLRFAVVDTGRRRALVPLWSVLPRGGNPRRRDRCFHGKRNPKHWQLRGS
jgi:hypothetical protein